MWDLWKSSQGHVSPRCFFRGLRSGLVSHRVLCLVDRDMPTPWGVGQLASRASQTLSMSLASKNSPFPWPEHHHLAILAKKWSFFPPKTAPEFLPCLPKWSEQGQGRIWGHLTFLCLKTLSSERWKWSRVTFEVPGCLLSSGGDFAETESSKVKGRAASADWYTSSAPSSCRSAGPHLYLQGRWDACSVWMHSVQKHGESKPLPSVTSGGTAFHLGHGGLVGLNISLENSQTNDIAWDAGKAAYSSKVWGVFEAKICGRSLLLCLHFMEDEFFLPLSIDTCYCCTVSYLVYICVYVLMCGFICA